MKKLTRYTLTMMVLFCMVPTPGVAEKSPYDWAAIQLDYIRQEKIEHLKRFTRRLHNFAKAAAADKQVVSFFEMNRQYYTAARAGKVPLSLTADIESLNRDFNTYYIARYFVFYDILFVDPSGVVFHTIRKEMDTHANLAENRELFGALGNVISQKPRQETFVDFYRYRPSSEPAAFFIEPVYDGDALHGWIVLQCAVNKLNTIFASTDDMGQTGETFLVNQDGVMLTESYFKDDSTILRQHLDDQNIKPKFKDRSGHRDVLDYRGEKALTSFEVFEFLGTKWLVVAKIDKNEIATAHYKRHRQYYSDQLTGYLKKQSPLGESPAIPFKSGHPLRVDMDEFLKASNNERLETWGVSTCTAFLATVPQKFAYLAHISPKDKVYGGDDTNILEQITKRIKKFDIYPYQRRQVQFFVIAPHLESVLAIVNQLTRDGFFLSQIWVSYNPSATSAAVISDYETGSLYVTWKMPGTKKDNKRISPNPYVNVGEVLNRFVSIP